MEIYLIMADHNNGDGDHHVRPVSWFLSKEQADIDCDIAREQRDEAAAAWNRQHGGHWTQADQANYDDFATTWVGKMTIDREFFKNARHSVMVVYYVVACPKAK